VPVTAAALAAAGELDGREAERAAGPAAVAGLALRRRRHVVPGAARVDHAGQREIGVGPVLPPQVGDREPVAVALADSLEEPGLDPHAVARELLPQPGADREAPRVHVARVDARARRQVHPAALVGAVAPQLEPGPEG